MTDRSLRAFVMEATVRAGADPLKPDEMGVLEWMDMISEIAARLRTKARIGMDDDGQWTATFTRRPSCDRDGLTR